MTTLTTTSVIFIVPDGIPDVPEGRHAGYLEHLHIRLGGHTLPPKLARSMLHLERSEYPDYFSSQNSAI